MDPFRFRPQVESLDTRVNPAISPTDVFNAVATIDANAVVLQELAQTATEYRSPATVSALATRMREFQRQSIGATGVFTEFLGAINTRIAANPAESRTLAPLARATVDKLALTRLVGVYADAFATAYGAPPLSPPAAPPPPASPPTSPPPTSTTPPPANGSTLSTTIPSLTDPAFREVSAAPGLRVQDVVEGTGDTAAFGDDVSVRYRGFLADTGAEFDSNAANSTIGAGKDPLNSNLSAGSLIPGFYQGVAGMKVGGVRRIDIPANLGYGATGSPPSIPPNARLVFEVQLLDTGPAGTLT